MISFLSSLGEYGTYLLAVEEIVQHVGISSVEDSHVHARVKGYLCGVELCYHWISDWNADMSIAPGIRSEVQNIVWLAIKEWQIISVFRESISALHV